jgi:hypothetical protein
MAEIQEFRSATLSLASKNLAFVVHAKVEERWESVAIPVYRDEPTVRSLPTLKKIVATIRRRYQNDSALHSAVDGSPATLSFDSGGESISFSQARVIGWKIYGELGGEMMEEVELAVEEEG